MRWGGVISIFRDMRYLAFAAGLAAVIIASVAARGSGSSAAQPSATAQPAPTVAARTPLAARTPTAAEKALDDARMADLTTIAEALDAYHKEFSSYPSTYGDFQLVCGTTADAACALRSFNPALPSRDRNALGYWYRSDGATFALFAAAAVQPIPNDCPRTLPPALSGGPIICLSSKGGGQ